MLTADQQLKSSCPEKRYRHRQKPLNSNSASLIFSMRISQAPPALLSLLLVALSNIDTAQAWPVGAFDFNALLGRDTCVSYCGASNQYCCTAGTVCTTLQNNVASCVAGVATSAAVGVAGGGGWGVYTTTWTETDLVTRTSTYSSSWAAPTSVAPVAPAPVICNTNLGETSCGPICCASNQRCASSGQCAAKSSSGDFVATSTAAGSSYSAPLRPTSGGVSTQTSTASATTTQPFIPPATASGSSLPITSSSGSKGLSPGAIAGIVIGTIAGIILLLLICFCCILRAGFDGLLGLFGLGKRRRRSTERVETVERYSRHGSGTASRRDTHTGWFGMGGRRPASSRVRVDEKKKSSGFGGLGAVGAGLIGLAVILGLKRKNDKKPSHAAVSDYSSTYYSDSFTGTSASKYNSFKI